MDEQLEQYLLQRSEQREDWMQQLEEFARQQGVPIMDSLSMDFLRQLIRLQKPARILEIGTAIGYSSLMMAEASPRTAIVTIERDEERYRQALENVKAQHKESQIKVVYGDALEVVDTAARLGPYDCIFIDAAKGQYQRFFEMYTPFLNEDGMVITDNVLFRGLVAAENPDTARRLANIAKKVKSFNDWLLNQQMYHTTIVPIGDGMAVSIRK